MADVKNENTALKWESREIRTRISDLEASRDQYRRVMAARQMVKDLERNLIDEVLTCSGLHVDYPEEADRWGLNLKTLLKTCSKMSKTRSAPHASARDQLNNLASRAGYRDAEALSNAIRYVAKPGNDCAHDDPRKQLNSLSVLERAALVQDSRLARLYEERCTRSSHPSGFHPPG